LGAGAFSVFFAGAAFAATGLTGFATTFAGLAATLRAGFAAFLAGAAAFLAFAAGASFFAGFFAMKLFLSNIKGEKRSKRINYFNYPITQ
jgi:hypothetical protein